MSGYLPMPVPNDPKDLPAFIRTELNNIARSWLESNHYLMLEKTYTAPKKLSEGMVVFADGTTWNPGSGAGAYIYRGGAWHFLG